MSDAEQTGASSPVEAAQGPAVSPPESGLKVPLWGPLAVTVLLAISVWLVMDRTFPVFQLPAELQNPPSPTPVELIDKINEATARMTRQNALLVYGFTGALAGLILGVWEGVLQRRGLGGAAGAALGLLVGGLAGASGACCAQEFTLWLRSRETVDSMQLAIASHASGWGLLGGGIGLALAMLGRNTAVVGRALVGGAAGGALCGVLLPVVAAYVLPDSNSELIVPDPGIFRIVWLLCGLGAALSGAVAMGRSSGVRTARAKA